MYSDRPTPYTKCSLLYLKAGSHYIANLLQPATDGCVSAGRLEIFYLCDNLLWQCDLRLGSMNEALPTQFSHSKLKTIRYAALEFEIDWIGLFRIFFIWHLSHSFCQKKSEQRLQVGFGRKHFLGKNHQWRQYKNFRLVNYSRAVVVASVTRFDQISPKGQYFKTPSQFLKGKFQYLAKNLILFDNFCASIGLILLP